MDPKMDSGLMEQDAADNYDVLQHRLPEEIIGILDQLLSHEVRRHSRKNRETWLRPGLAFDKGDCKVGLMWRELYRLHGIREAHYHRHCSPIYISTGYSRRHQEHSQKLDLEDICMGSRFRHLRTD